MKTTLNSSFLEGVIFPLSVLTKIGFFTKIKKYYKFMNVVQSFLTTIIKGDFSLYEVRIFMRIVALANEAQKGKKASSRFGKSFCADGINWNLTISIADILSGNSHHYEDVRNALQSLQKKIFTMYFPEHKEWRSAALLDNIRIADGSGTVRFVVPNWLIEYILTFYNDQFSEYDLQLALTLPSATAVRMYWLTCSMNDPIPYSIKILKEILGVADKYPSTKDFIRRCIDKPMSLLAEKNLNGFKYERLFSKNRIVGLKLIPVKRQTEKTTQLTARASLSAWVNPALRDYLTTQANLRVSEMAAHKADLFEFCKLDGWQDKIVRIVGRARRGRKGKGYIFAAIRNEVSDARLDNSTIAHQKPVSGL